MFCKPKCGLCSLLYALRVCKPGSTGAGAVAPFFSIPAPNGCALCCIPKNPDFEGLPSVLVVLLKAPLRSKVITKKKKSFPVLHLVLELFFKLEQAFKDCSVRQLKAPHVSGFKRRHLSHLRPCLCLSYFNCKLWANAYLLSLWRQYVKVDIVTNFREWKKILFRDNVPIHCRASSKVQVLFKNIT